jgi:hypothetical protein
MLLYPFEEQINLPFAFVKIGSQEHIYLAGFRITILDSFQRFMIVYSTVLSHQINGLITLSLSICQPNASSIRRNERFDFTRIRKASPLADE